MKKRLYISPKAKFHHLRVDHNFLVGSETIPGTPNDGSGEGTGNGEVEDDY